MFFLFIFFTILLKLSLLWRLKRIWALHQRSVQWTRLSDGFSYFSALNNSEGSAKVKNSSFLPSFYVMRRECESSIWRVYSEVIRVIWNSVRLFFLILSVFIRVIWNSKRCFYFIYSRFLSCDMEQNMFLVHNFPFSFVWYETVHASFTSYFPVFLRVICNSKCCLSFIFSSFHYFSFAYCFSWSFSPDIFPFSFLIVLLLALFLAVLFFFL